MQERDRNIRLLFIFLVLLLRQGVYAEWRPAIPDATGEEVLLFTDRALYAVEEELFFAVSLGQPVLPGSADWSRVVYVELIRWDGSKLVQAKVPVEEGLAKGSLVIPDDLNSGNYYLRAYTKWMRNYSPYRYTYVKVKVVNPHRKSIDPGPSDETADVPAMKYLVSGCSDEIGIDLVKASCQRREMVEAEIMLPGGTDAGDVLVAVRLKESGEVPWNRCFSFESLDTVPADGPAFLPEIYGLTVSGKILDAVTGEPVAGSTVNLSSYSSSFYFSTTRSGEDGLFIFTLPPETGTRELHLAEEGEDAGEHELLITSEFCNQPVTLPYEPFLIAGHERAVAEQLIVNAQLMARFRDDRVEDERDADEVAPFYGRPLSTTYVKEYIELIDLREFFFELVQPVLVNYNDQGPYLALNTQGSMALYPPLVLMDNIPVENGGRLLEIPSARVSRIEVINKGYLVNNRRYSGIISIFSENRDMAGLEMEEKRHFFNFSFFQEQQEDRFPEYVQATTGSTVPDLRNLLCWETGFQLTPGEAGQLHFFTCDAPGTYEVVVMHIGEDGKAVCGRSEFEVR